jgi:hypothetical protein
MGDRPQALVSRFHLLSDGKRVHFMAGAGRHIQDPDMEGKCLGRTTLRDNHPAADLSAT